MNQKETIPPRYTLQFFRVVFYFCSLYFFLMGIGLIFFPELLVRGVTGGEVNPTITGMLRGSGGAILPYTMLYIIMAKNPFLNRWGLWVIALANILAIILDLASVFLAEYKLSYAMYDLPVEILSLSAICIIVLKTRKPKK